MSDKCLTCKVYKKYCCRCPESSKVQTPTREEWSLWIKRKPLAHEYTSYEAWTEAIGSWLLSMPIVPKG